MMAPVELFNFKRAPRARERQRSSGKQVIIQTLSVNQLFNINRAPRARERQGTPGSAECLIFT